MSHMFCEKCRVRYPAGTTHTCYKRKVTRSKYAPRPKPKPVEPVPEVVEVRSHVLASTVDTALDKSKPCPTCGRAFRKARSKANASA